MRFMSVYSIANSKISLNSTTNSTPIRTFNTMRFATTPKMVANVERLTTSLPSPPLPSISNEKKVKWGPAVWYFLHTLSVKIKEESFIIMRKELLEMVYMICINLPCPDCSQHAKIYLDKVNFNAIQTRDDFKKMLYNFHNSVNARKGYPLFEYEKLDEMYSKAILIPIFQNFFAHFQDRKYRSIKLLATDLHRNLMCNDLKKWFKKNWNIFTDNTVEEFTDVRR